MAGSRARVSDSTPDGQQVVGYPTADTLIRVSSTLLDKPGGYLTNDVMPPSVFLDNIPNWELGVLTQVRDLSRVIRNDYSRSQSQSREGVDGAAAGPVFFWPAFWLCHDSRKTFSSSAGTSKDDEA